MDAPGPRRRRGRVIPARPLDGKKTRLRPLGEQHLPLLVRWLNTPEIRYWLHQSERPDATVTGAREHFLQPVDEGRAVAWVIETLDGRPLGNLRLLEMDPHHRRCELGITIGEVDALGQGYGADAIVAALAYAFGELGLRRVGLITDADNGRGIRCYEKCGFVREGLLRSHRLRHGKPVDMVAMGLLREEWEKPEA